MDAISHSNDIFDETDDAPWIEVIHKPKKDAKKEAKSILKAVQGKKQNKNQAQSVINTCDG